MAWQTEDIDTAAWGVFQQQRRSHEDIWQVKKFGPFRYYAVFDGHQGNHKLGLHHVAYHAAENLHYRFADGLTKVDLTNRDKVCRAIQDIFIRFDAEMKHMGLLYGSTCTAILIDDIRGIIYQINLGDSRSLIMYNNKSIATTQDHKPTCQKEKDRIFRVGGAAWGEQIASLLTVSRGFGDFRLKQTHASEYDPINGFVSAEPDVHTLVLQSNQYVLLTTDAPFENNVMDNQDLLTLFYESNTKTLLCDVAFDIGQYIVSRTTDDVTLLLVVV